MYNESPSGFCHGLYSCRDHCYHGLDYCLGHRYHGRHDNHLYDRHDGHLHVHDVHLHVHGGLPIARHGDHHVVRDNKEHNHAGTSYPVQSRHVHRRHYICYRTWASF